MSDVVIVTTKDGLKIENVPKGTTSADPRLREIVAQLRASGQKTASYGPAPAQPQPTAAPPEPAPGQPPLEMGQGRVQDLVMSPPRVSNIPETAMNMMGGVVRGAGPIAAGAALGGAAGSVVPGVGTVAGAAAGAGAMGLAQLAGDPIIAGINDLFGTKYTMPTDAIEDLFTRIGVAEPKTEAEKLVQTVASGTAQAGGSVALGQALMSGAGLSPGTRELVGQALASGPLQQILGGAGASAGAGMAAQMGAGPVAQFGAGLAGGAAGSAVGNAMNLRVPQSTAPIKEAERAGVKLMTSDVLPPTTPVARSVQTVSEKLPLFGTGPLRAEQQTQRVSAVKDLLRQFGADDAAAASDDVMRDLAAKRSGNIGRWSSMKNQVIDDISSAKPYKVDDYIIPEPQLNSKQISQLAQLSEYGMTGDYSDLADDAAKMLDKSGVDYIDAYHVAPLKDIESIKRTGIKGTEWYGRKSGVYLFADPSDIEKGYDYLNIKKTIPGPEEMGVIHFKIPKEDVSKLSWDGRFNITFGTYSAFHNAGDVDPSAIIDVKKIIMPDAKDVGTGSKVLLDPQSIYNKATVPMTATTAKIDTSISALKGLKTAEVAPVISILEDWKQAIQGQDLRNIETLRKQIGEAFTAPELASVRSTGERVLSDIYGAVREDMTKYIGDTGGQQALNKWQIANKELSKLMGELDLDILKTTLEKGAERPEAVRNMLFNKDRSVIESLNRNLTAKGRAAARTAVMQEVGKKIGEDASPEKFVSEIRRLKNAGDPVGVFFTRDDLQAVEGLARVLKVTARASQAPLNPPTGAQLLIPFGTAGLSAGLTQSFGGGVEGFLGSIAAIGGAGMAARAYESAPVRNILMKIPTVKPGSVEEAALFKRLLEAAQAVQAVDTTTRPSAPTRPMDTAGAK